MKTTSSVKSAKKSARHESGTDAIELLTKDHNKVKHLFKDFEKLKERHAGESEKANLVKRICQELTVHTQIEEEIFYPEVRNVIEDQDLFDEAEVEHSTAKDLIAQLEGMSPDEDLYDAKVTVLSEYTNHHVREEQEEMFPQVKKAKIDTEELGARMMARKQDLTPMVADESEHQRTH